jgi:adenine deaminase
MVMLCSDDLHPEMLHKRHINKLISSLIADGYDMFDVLRSATINPNDHYKLGMGMLREGDSADFVIVNSLRDMNVLETWISGNPVFKNSDVLFNYQPAIPVNKFICSPVNEADISVTNKKGNIRVITATEGQLLTGEEIIFSGESDFVMADTEKDILKIVVKDRYRNHPPVAGFIKGFGLKNGAFASSIAHDSHNIIAVGVSDKEIVSCINRIIELKGGLAVSWEDEVKSLELNIAGIMTTSPCDEIAAAYEDLNHLVQSLGCSMKSPFMTLSFMALLVIPDLKIGDRGLFDVRKFEPVSLFL